MFRLITHLLQSSIVLCIFSVLGQTASKIEPKAGTWKTWAISSGRDYRAPAPPDAAATRAEVETVRGFIAEEDPRVADQVAYWDAGAPSYRWIEGIYDRILSGANVTPYPPRIYTYVAMAMYDATVATWESKYAYNRLRPVEVDPTLQPRLPTPGSPSYPSEHAATAAAAAAVLGYFFPAEAASFQALGEEAGISRVYAGLQFPSDHFAGLELAGGLQRGSSRSPKPTARMQSGRALSQPASACGPALIPATSPRQAGSLSCWPLPMNSGLRRRQPAIHPR